MLISTRLTELPVGCFADMDRIRELIPMKEDSVDIEQAIRIYTTISGGTRPRNITDLYEKFGGARFPVQVLPSPESRYSLGIDGGMHSKGEFDIPGLGSGHCFTRQQRNYVDPEKPFRMLIAFRLDDVPVKTLQEGVVSAAIHMAPKNFPHIPGENVPGVACIPLDILLEPERRYDHGTGGGFEREVKALICAVDCNDLIAIAGDSGGVSFYATLMFENDTTIFINRDGIPGNNFLIRSDEEFKDLGTP